MLTGVIDDDALVAVPVATTGVDEAAFTLAEADPENVGVAEELVGVTVVDER